MDVLDRADLPFPHSRYPSSSDFSPMMRLLRRLPGESPLGRRLCLPALRHVAGEPFHFENRPGVLRCRKCRQNHRADGGNSDGA